MTNLTHADTTQLLDIVRGLARELRPGANGIDRLGLDHALESDLGLDSLARVELLARIERELGVRLAEAAFAEAETPRDLLRQMGVAESMVFFAEGTFVSEPGLLPFRMGAFMLAARTGVSVLPIGLVGTRTLLRGESWRPHYSALKVDISTHLQ